MRCAPSTYCLLICLGSSLLAGACRSNNGAEGSQNAAKASQASQPLSPSNILSNGFRDPKSGTFNNSEAVIPPQCYTRTDGTHNPCYVCHQVYSDKRPNQMLDGSLQGSYELSDEGRTNHWTNLFVDRREKVAKITDEAIDAYVDQDNYSALAKLLQGSDWKGYIPDLSQLENGALAFDHEGFAKDKSGWVAFNYKPLPSTFWPTNGATDDVMIRLPAAFRESSCNTAPSPELSRPGLNAMRDVSVTYIAPKKPNRDVYLANLAILEATIQDLPRVSTPVIDEKIVCRDLNGDGELSQVKEILRPSHYVGQADNIPVSPMLYPTGTEFLHSVRYVGVAKNGDIVIPKRMKELRYMKKYRFRDKGRLYYLYDNERGEKMEGALPSYGWRGDTGMANDWGWRLSAFIENDKGELRQQTREEHFFCMGCHTTIGTTIDQTFSFARKVRGASGWGYINLRGMVDAPNRKPQQAEREKAKEEPSKKAKEMGEIAEYLMRAGGGSEFRSNEEMLHRWFTKEGKLNTEKIAQADVYSLITPSPKRARQLNKAYQVIVKEQSFERGRDPTITPPRNVYKTVDPDKAPPLEPEARYYGYDIRLEW